MSDAAIGDDHPFLEQQRPLCKEIASVTAELAAGGDHAMAGDGGVACLAHDVPHGAMCPRAAGGRRDVAVRCDAARGNPPDDGSDAGGKVGRTRHW